MNSLKLSQGLTLNSTFGVDFKTKEPIFTPLYQYEQKEELKKMQDAFRPVKQGCREVSRHFPRRDWTKQT